MVNYIDRACCPIESTLNKLNASEQLLFLIGPSSSGKSTTLNKLWLTARSMSQKAYYVDVESDDGTFCKPKETELCFVDNAQKLKHRNSLIRVLKYFKSLCLAFSPTVLDETGNSLSKCPFKYTELVCFTPFSTEEFSAYARKKTYPVAC